MRATRALAIALLALAPFVIRAEAVKAHHTKSLAPRPGGTLKVEGAFHDVTVILSPTATRVDVVVDMEVSQWPGDAKAYLESLKPTFEEAASGITVRSKSKENWTFGVSRCDGKIAVTLPPGMALHLGTGSGEVRVAGDTSGMPVTCETGSGSVSVEGRLKGLRVETGSGDVTARLEGPCGGVHLETGSGGIEFRGAAPSFFAETGSGEITAIGLAGSATFDTGSGEVVAGWSTLPDGAKISADTGSGGVQFTLPAGASPTGTLEAGSGGVTCALPATCDRNHRKCTLQGRAGGPQMKVETGSGGIELRLAS